MLYKHEVKSGRRQNLAGTEYQRGDLVPDSVLAVIPPGRVASMKRVGLLLEVVTPVGDDIDAIVAPSEDEPELVEGICPECNEGPFKRLAQHISSKHESIEELQESLNGSAR